MKKRVKYSRVFNYDRTNKLRYDGTATIYIRAYLNSKNKYFPTGIYVRPSQWDKKNCRVINHPDQADLNFEISTMERDLASFETKVLQKVGQITLDKLADYKENDIDISFTQFYKDQLEKSNLAIETIRDQNQTFDKLSEFRKSIEFYEVNFELIDRFNSYLFKKGLQVNTVAKHHKNLRKYVNVAIKYKHIQPGDNPYLLFKIKKEKTDPLYLLEEELKLLETLDVNGEIDSFRKILDFYLFCCWTGARFEDANVLKAKNFTQTEKGLELYYKEKKTGKPRNLNLRKLFDGKPERLILDYLEKYDDVYIDDPDNPKPIFFDYSNGHINRTLKKIAKKLSVRERVWKRLHCHSARHTFGTILAGKVPIYTLQKLLQHSKIKETEHYAHLSRADVERDLDKVEWYT